MCLNFFFISSCKQKYSFVMKKGIVIEICYQLITCYQVKIKKV